MANNHMHLHDAFEVDIKGNMVLVDCGIIDLVLWMNQIPGLDTFTSCQGGAECCRPDAFIGFTSIDPKRPKEIQEHLGYGRLSEHNDRYELSLDVSELVALNQQHFPDSQNWKDAFARVLNPGQENAEPGRCT